ncbi:MAG: grasp-with-spasm system SPASM domain peptide maturase [Haliscomenobacter sp.]|nr:grasp-with-spasm system SPASM domain peptide maturase [Haliscomenobacter sp.]
MDLSWKSPLWITNAIIDISKNSSYDIAEALKQLDGVGCIALHLRFFSCVQADYLHQLLLSVKNSRLVSIDLLLGINQEFQTFDDLQVLANKHLRITSIVIYGSDKDRYYVYKGVELVFTSSILNSELHCGKISDKFFTANISLFTEAQHHNSCLNRKIAIDIEGNIKNCPSMKESFGNIRDTTLQEALEKPGFKKYWNITKDQIQTCKDCEFRYICTDCRAYLEAPEDIYSKPLKCGYNPYTCEWEEWSTNPLKQKAIAHYGMESLKADAGPPEAQ